MLNFCAKNAIDFDLHSVINSKETKCLLYQALKHYNALLQNLVSLSIPQFVFFNHYGLTNFYQNHRRYVKSRDESQLLGDVKKTPNTDCKPFDEMDVDGKKVPIVPCGAIANSLFNGKLIHFSSL